MTRKNSGFIISLWSAVDALEVVLFLSFLNGLFFILESLKLNIDDFIVSNKNV